MHLCRQRVNCSAFECDDELSEKNLHLRTDVMQ